MIRRYSAWIWLAATLAVIAVISVLSIAPAAPLPLDDHSARPNGALAARLWLSRMGRTSTDDRSLNLEHVSFGTTLLLLTPQSALTRRQARDLVIWIQHGGHLVLATEGDSASSLLELLGLDIVPGGGGEVRVVQPLLSAPPVQSLAGTASAVVSGEPRGAVVLAVDDGPVLLYRLLGRGALWVLTARDLLDNAHLGRADNRRLLLNLAGPGRPIVFETYSGSAVPSGSDWLTGTVWGAALLFAIAIIIVFRWLSGLRLGPALPAPEQQPRATVEYVTSLAGLLQQARRRADVLHLYQGSLQRALAERWGNTESLDGDRRVEVECLLLPAGDLSEQELRERAAAIVECEELLRRERV